MQTRTSWNQQGSSTATMSHRHLPASTSTLRVDIRGAEILDENESIETSDIYLPKHTEFISHIALDIGGSLAKVVYFTRAVDLEAPRENHPKPSGGVTSHQASASQQELHSSGRSRVEQPSRSSSPQSSSSNDPEPSNLSNSLPHSSARSSVSQPNGILHPTVVREELYNSRARSLDPTNPQVTCNPSADLPDHPTTRGNDAEHSQLTNKLTSLSNVKPQAPFRNPKERLSRSSSISSIPGGRLNFIKFETNQIESECITFISNLIQLSAESNRVPISTMKRGVKIILTGGGAYMYADFIKTALGGDVEVLSEDEMDCLITGLNFITEIPNEVFWFSDQLVQEIIHNNPTDPKEQEKLVTENSTQSFTNIQKKTKSSSISPPPPDPSFDDPSAAIEQFPRPSPNPPQYSVLFDSNPSPQFPCMLVNIGSGVSIIKVTNFGKFERISGTSLGGGTLWGLLSLLTEAKSFDEMLDLSIKGDNSKVDMLVGDIYGQDYGKIGLKSSTIASSFGKVFKKKSSSAGRPRDDPDNLHDPPKVEFKPEDISKSLLYAISNNIGQIAHLNAEKHGLDRIYFGGCFIRGHAATVSTLSYAIRFWSKGTKRAFFLRHEGYLGSIGAWLKNIGHEIDQASSSSSSSDNPPHSKS